MEVHRSASFMAVLDSTDPCFTVAEDLFDFNFDASSSSMESSIPTATVFRREPHAGSLPEFEEELEWLSNKDAFPSVDTCFGILADNPDLISSHQSPVSVLENSSNSNTSITGSITPVASYCCSLKVPENFPVRSRSKRSRRKRLGSVGLPRQQCLWLNQTSLMKTKQEPPSSSSISLPTLMTPRVSGMGRRCLHCQTDKTPQWRAGPMGPKTLCNACGVRYKSGRLLPEYRPASSPTFSSVLHSNSHRKVVEMRRKKQMPETAVSESSGYTG